MKTYLYIDDRKPIVYEGQVGSTARAEIEANIPGVTYRWEETYEASAFKLSLDGTSIDIG